MRRFERGGPGLAYQVVGDGFPVILHTGAAGDSRMWRDAGYVEGLAAFQVVLLDHCGHGASDVPDDPAAYTVASYVADVVGLADELGLDRFAFWGYSDGADVGYALAAEHPERVAALVASGGVDGPDDGPERRREATRLVRKRGIGAILGDEPAPDWLLRQLVDETDAEVVARELEGFAGWFPWPLIPRHDAPTLIVAREHEAEHVPAAAASIPRGRAVILPGHGLLGAFLRSDLLLPEALPRLRQPAASDTTTTGG
jgi:pimeloyl-ACP methyl ester carboxylesterase